MRLPLLIASSATESPVIHLFDGHWKVYSDVAFSLTINADTHLNGNINGARIVGPCNIQLKRTSNNPITVYAELL